MFAQVQRLATVDDDVADIVLLDVASVLVITSSVDAAWAVVHQTSEACARAGRVLICAIVPGALVVADRASLRALETRVRQLQLRRIYSKKEPLPSLAYEAVQAGRQVTLVLGTVSETTTWCLSPTEAGERPVSSILDISTGRLHTDAWATPAVVARTEAILRTVTRNYKENYKEPVAHQLGVGIQVVAERSDYLRALEEKSKLPAGEPLPEWLTTPWQTSPSKNKNDVLNAIDAAELDLLRWRHPSPRARAELAAAIAAIPQHRLNSGYVCADVRRGVDHWRLERIECRFQGGWRSTDEAGAPAMLREFLVEFPGRWFGPRIVDLLAWMLTRGLTLPARGGDPAWTAFVLDPESETGRPLDLARYSSRVLRLPPRAHAWLGDLRREASAPLDIASLARSLPSLDAHLAAFVSPPVRQLLDEDIEPTLPVIAAIEERGVTLGTPAGSTWAEFAAALEGAQQTTTAEARGVLLSNVDFFRDPKLTVRAIEKAIGQLPMSERKGLRMADLMKRYMEIFGDVLEPVARARSLAAVNQERPLGLAVRSGVGSIHAVTIPQSGGRLGLSSPRLQSLPKNSPEGIVLRSALAARPGHVLLAFDYNAFEARIVADLSDDPILLAACRSDEAFVELAKILFKTTSPTGDQRTHAKLGFYALLFGQTRGGFWKQQHALTRADAEALFDLATHHLSVLLAYRDDVYDQLDKSRCAETRGGWRRTLNSNTKNERRREGFSVVVQGLAADILRRVLRLLHIRLAPFHAGVIHHIHDEVFVTTPLVNVDDVERVVLDVMTGAPYASPALLQRVKLVVKRPRRGETWADLA